MNRIISMYLNLPAGFRIFVAALAVILVIATLIVGC